MIAEYSDYWIAISGLALAVLGFILKREHQRLEKVEDGVDELSARVSRAINDIAKNDVSDREWRKRVEENHFQLLKADEDRRNDARKIYDKIEGANEKIQRLAEKVAAVAK